MADGYISDVPSRVSNSPSDVSNDLVQSTKVLERNFKDRYRLLKGTYESRLKQLAGLVAETCARIADDEIVKEMKADRTSLTFLPAHITEIVEASLHSEKEAQVKELIARTTAQDAELQRAKATADELRDRLSAMETEVSRGRRAELQLGTLEGRLVELQKEFEAFSKQSDMDTTSLNEEKAALQAALNKARSENQQLSLELESRTRELQELRVFDEEKDSRLKSLEETFEQNARELEIMEEVERRDRAQHEALRNQLLSLTQENKELSALSSELRAKLLACEDELSRNRTVFEKLAQEDDSVKGHVSHLMATVEQLLADEAKESNETLQLMHRKMKSMKEQYSIELNKERRLAKGVQDEVLALRNIRDDQHRQITHLHELSEELRARVVKEQERGNAAHAQLQEASRVNITLQAKIKDMELSEKLLQEKLREIEKVKDTELKLYGEKVKLETERNIENEKAHLEKRKEAYRLHYENELAIVQNSVRNSYNFESRSPEVAMSVDAALRVAQEGWSQERSRLESEYSAQISRAQVDASRRFVDRLQEADNNIERLKVLLKEKLSVIENQNELIKSLKSLTEKQQIQIQQIPVSTNNSFANNGFGSSQSVASSTSSVQSRSHRYAEQDDEVNTSASWDKTIRNTNTSTNSFNDYFKNKNNLMANTSTSTNSNIMPEIATSVEPSMVNKNGPKTNDSIASSVDATRLSKLLQDQETLLHQSRALEDEIDQLREENRELLLQNKELSEDNEQMKEYLEECQEQAIKDSEALAAMTLKCQSLLASHGKLVARSAELSNSQISQASRGQPVEETEEVENIGASNILDTTNVLDSLDESQIQKDLHNVSAFDSESADVEEDNNKSKMSASFISKEEHLSLLQKVSDQEMFISTLEIKLSRHMELLQTSQEEASLERRKALELNQQLATAREILFKLNLAYKSELTQLRVLLKKMQSEVELVQPAFEADTRKTLKNIQTSMETRVQTLKASFEKRLHEQRLQLSNAHSIEMEVLEKKYSEKITELTKLHKDELSATKATFVAKAESAISSLKSAVPSYESVCNGMLEGLQQQGVISAEQFSHFVDLAKKHAEPSYAAASLSKALVSECVLNIHQKHRQEMSAFETEYNLLREENAMLVHQQQQQQNTADSNSVSTMTASIGNNNSGLSHSNQNNSKLDSLAEQDNHRDSVVLAELSKIESESQIRSLQDEIEEIRSLHAIEVEKLKGERAAIESRMRKNFESELVSLRASEKGRLASLESDLREERNIRLKLQATLAEVEKEFESTVENLEKENQQLLARLSNK